jgi:uncharacterized membrane protein
MATVLLLVVLWVDVRIGMAALRARRNGRRVTWIIVTLAGSLLGGALLTAVFVGRAVDDTERAAASERMNVILESLSRMFYGVGLAVAGALVAAVGLMFMHAGPGPNDR